MHVHCERHGSGTALLQVWRETGKRVRVPLVRFLAAVEQGLGAARTLDQKRLGHTVLHGANPPAAESTGGAAVGLRPHCYSLQR